MNLKDKKVLVFGAGKSGISSTSLLQKQGATVILYDGNPSLTLEQWKDKFDVENHIIPMFGEFKDEIIKEIDLLVISPGVAIDNPMVLKIQSQGVPVWGEIELAYSIAKGKIVGITGTNGKTTTTSLVGDIMKTWFQEVYVVGNIGTPYTDVAMETTEAAVSVIELSSFQLETIHEFRPNVSAILNITPDHLNRHHTMETYIAMKENIAKNQTMEDCCILNYEDEVLREMAKRLPTRVMFFSSERELEYGLYLLDNHIYYANNGKKELVCKTSDLQILGKHSYENVMAAVGMAIHMGVPMECIYKAITAFQAVEHRIEYVATIHGVAYYNDSKGTNPDASIKAVQAMQGPTIVIGGGYDKESNYDSWIETFHGKVRYLVLLGQTREKIADAAKRLGFHDIIMVDSLKEAVEVSASKANPGDSVLLSPACASWGMFDNYEQRGNYFKEYVRAMIP